MEHPLHLLIQLEEDQAGVDPCRRYAHAACELSRRVAVVLQSPVGACLLPGGMYLFECAEFVLEVWLLEVNGNLRFVHQISESRAPKICGEKSRGSLWEFRWG